MIAIKKHYFKNENIIGEIYYNSYYEFTGKIDYITPVKSIIYIDENNIQREMFYLILNFICDDPTEKSKTIYFYAPSEELVKYPFEKLEEKDSIILYLIKKSKNNTGKSYLWQHPNDKSKYKPCEYTNHGGFIFKNNFKNSILIKNQLSFKRYLFLFFLVLGLFFLSAFDYDNESKAYTIFSIYLIVVFYFLFLKP